jgi:transcriptional regulator with XRE-family HTH domain
MTAEQLRAARALLRWSQSNAAERASVSLETIKRLERMTGPLTRVHVETLQAIQDALEQGGVEFIDENGGGPGVRLKKSAGNESP